MVLVSMGSKGLDERDISTVQLHRSTRLHSFNQLD